MLEQLRNDVNSSNLMENDEMAEGEESCSDEAHVSMDDNLAPGFDNESFAVAT